jgi:hypothetical protein
MLTAEYMMALLEARSTLPDAPPMLLIRAGADQGP